MEYSWILPAAEQLYANREDIQNNFQKASNWLLGEKRTIVITGLPGVGKTVLSDYLTDVAYKKGYASPVKSEDLETRKTSIEKQWLDFKVIPGQDSPQRHSIQGQSEFSNRLRRLSNQVGSDNFSWDALPFCGKLDDFTLDTQVCQPQLREKQRDHYIAQFSKKLVAMCKANS
jgi:hypothetical protein